MKFGTWDANDDEWYATLINVCEHQRKKFALLQQIKQTDDRLIQYESKIPRILHQIWLGEHPIPAHCQKWMKTWQQLHPSWEYRLWKDADAVVFPMQNRRAFIAASNYGMKSDVFRYEILAHYGGFYVDIDMECLQSFDMIATSFAFVVGMSNTNTVELNNAVIGAAAQHPILLRLIEKIAKIQLPSIPSACLQLIATMSGNSSLPSSLATETIELTGPGLLTRTVMEAIGWQSSTPRHGLLTSQEKEEVAVLDVNVLYPLPNDQKDDPSKTQQQWPPEAMAVHYWERTWLKH